MSKNHERDYATQDVTITTEDLINCTFLHTLPFGTLKQQHMHYSFNFYQVYSI